MENHEAYDHIYAQFQELEKLDSLEKLNTFIEDTKLESSIKAFYTKYPSVDFRLTKADIEKLKSDKIIETDTIALRFGIGCEADELEQREKCYYEDYFGSDSAWDFAILKIETAQMTITEICKGAYSGIYQPTLLMFQHLNYCRVMLIDVCKYLSQFDGYEKSKANAKRDSEWLILPANPIGSLNEFSAILDGGNSFTYKTFKK